MSRSLGALALLCLASTPALADLPRDQVFPEVVTRPAVLTPEGLAPYNTIFLNRCKSGCPVRVGTTDSRSDHSSLAGGSVMIQSFKGTDAQWQYIVDCVKDTFGVFNINVTDVDPGTADHFEIMVAGYSSDLQNPQISSNTFGVSPFNCQGPFLPDALVFDFANQFIDNPGAFGLNKVEEEICATAAQEISHAFTLDHVVVSSDPMTYNTYIGRRYFAMGGVQCGSDCVNGQGPFGQTCTGQNHACACTNLETQDEIGYLTNLFGAGPGTPPTITITQPQNGDNVMPGFPVGATASDNSMQPLSKIELRIDGTLIGTLTRAPYAWNAPSTLTNGTHTVEVTGYDGQGTPGKTSIMVSFGPPCQKDADCGVMGDVCIAGKCVAGPTLAGGLGTTCMGNSDCASQQCGSDGTHSYCVEACMTGQCPSGFGCQLTDATSGVCWPGFDDGSHSGGCAVAPGGAISSGLLFAALVFTRRRRRR